jgi:hypothetical protein
MKFKIWRRRAGEERATMKIRPLRHDVRSGTCAVLELRQSLQRIFGGARKHHLLVFHLERTECDDDVFQARTEKVPHQQHREGNFSVVSR